jgi:hypothetical protein
MRDARRPMEYIAATGCIIITMSKTEILAELAHLSPSDLADVKAWLDRHLTSPDAATAVDVSRFPPAGRSHLRTPRLADPARAADFVKQVVELPADAAV